MRCNFHTSSWNIALLIQWKYRVFYVSNNFFSIFTCNCDVSVLIIKPYFNWWTMKNKFVWILVHNIQSHDSNLILFSQFHIHIYRIYIYIYIIFTNRFLFVMINDNILKIIYSIKLNADVAALNIFFYLL